MIFNEFSADDIVVGRINQVSSGLFNNGNLYLNQSLFVTSSKQANVLVGPTNWDVRNGQYYTNVYAEDTEYFAVAYGDYVNSGSSYYNCDSINPGDQVLTNETKIIYSQYKNILLQPGDDLFSFASGSVSTPQDGESIFVMNFSADKMKDQIDPGQLQINFNGSRGEYSYIDDSIVVNKQQNVYNMISGSVINGVPTPYLKNGSVVYEGIGLFYPSNGVVIFNAINLEKRVGITQNDALLNRAVLGSNCNNNPPFEFQNNWRIWSRDFYNRLKQSTRSMAVRKSEFVPSTNYFVRVKNKEFNYTNNPTFVSDGVDGLTKGTIIYQDLINNPRTYITGVGLYNSDNELLAVGKLSRPVQKSFDSELLIKVRIDF